MPEPEPLTAAGRAKFEKVTGLPLPRSMVGMEPFTPHLQTDVAALIELNERVRIPADPWIGDRGDPWPEEHLVIGEDQCGNYYSVVRADRRATSGAAVWFYDHELATIARHHPSIAKFLAHLRALLPPVVHEPGVWRIVAQSSVGPIDFGMSRQAVRVALAAPFTEFTKGEGEEPTDAFDTLGVHVYYRNGGVEAMEFWKTENILLGGHRLGDETFNDVEMMIRDYVQQHITTATSVQSYSYGVEFNIASADQGDVVGAIHHLIAVCPGYFQRQAELLAAILRNPTA
jgi:hypothetical protein